MTFPMVRIAADGEHVDGKTFRDAMSRIATAVHVVATDGPAGLGGATMTAVASVTDTPPTLLICLNHGSTANALIKANGVFCVSVLPAEARALAEIFSGRTGLHGRERFTAGVWSPLVTGAPALDGARVAIDCHVSGVSEVGTHSVIFGAVAAVRTGADGPALAYLDRAFASLA